MHLPEGAEVEVRVVENPFTRCEVFTRVLASRINRRIDMAEVIEEDKREREEHPDIWLKS